MLYKINKSIHKVSRIIKKPDPTKIKRINFAITYRCNSRCKACSIWKTYREDSMLEDQELSLDQIKEFFSQGNYFDSLDEVALTGGEPFLRRDFRELFRYLRSRFQKTSLIITTNGLRIKKNWIENKNDVLWTVLVFSMDGLEETNDLVRGIKGSYQRVNKAINYYKELFPSLRMGISFTILPENYHDLRKVFDFSQKSNLSFTARFACKSDSYYGNSEMKVQWTDEMLQKVETDLDSIIKKISNSRNLLNRLLNPDLYFFSQMVNYQREKKRLFRCYSGTHSLFIDPYGNIFPCTILKEPLGNIVKDSFEDLWFSRGTEQKRLSIKNDECHCWTECETIPSLQRKVPLNFLENLLNLS